MAYAAAISTVVFIYFTVVIASHETCNMAVLTDTQLRQEIRNEVNGVKLYIRVCSSAAFLAFSKQRETE